MIGHIGHPHPNHRPVDPFESPSAGPQHGRENMEYHHGVRGKAGFGV